MKKIRSLVLFSGGLDSLLAVEFLRKKRIEVFGVSFSTPFFDAQKAERMAKNINLPLRVVDLTEKFLKILKEPKFGYGKHLNPCLDCKILMLKEAKKILKKEKFDFLATGEVLGQRPFSQNPRSLELVAKEAGVEDILLRPLSGKILKENRIQKKGILKKEELLDFWGKGRKRQIALAKKLKIKNWPSPSGGCLLTYPEFSLKTKKLLFYLKRPKKEDFLLLKTGRHFFEKNFWIIVGKNKEENLFLEKQKKVKGILAIPKFRGPTIFFPHQRKISSSLKKIAKDFFERFSKKKEAKEEEIVFQKN